jgi:NhaP-type Na+/H+ or K+/H+ antiporter
VELAVAFGAALIVAVLLSALAHRSVMSLPLLFLVVGVALGNGGLEVVSLAPDGQLVRQVAEVALFTVLFTDGMRALGTGDGSESWRPPVRALLIGMPLTAATIALLTWALTDLPLAAALLVGVVLSPTDPVLVSAFVRRDEVPHSLRHTLNVESGFNDGLALPGVVVLIAVLGSDETPTVWLLVFGALLEPHLLADLSSGGYLVAVLALLLARPASLVVSFVGAGQPMRERLAAAWFGPKGLASVLYGLWVLQSGVPQAVQVFAIVSLSVALSVVVHTSTDVAVARRLGTGELTGDQPERSP